MQRALNMKLKTLSALAAAVEEGSLRGAARRLNTSQPALTKMIRELEQELGAPLLSRTARGVTPTAQGKVLYERGVRARRELDAAVDEIQQLSGSMVGQLHIGAAPLAVMLLVPEALRSFSQEFPDIRLRLSEELFGTQLQGLRTGEFDMSLGGIPDYLKTPEFFMEPLLQTTMVPTARIGSPWLQARTLRDLQDAPWIYTGTHEDTGYAKTWFEQYGLTPPRKGVTVNSTLGMLSLVARGDYVALLPQQIAVQAFTTQFISVVNVAEHGLALEVGAILRTESAASPVIGNLLKHLHRAAYRMGRNALG